VAAKSNFVGGAIDCLQFTDVEELIPATFKIYPNPATLSTTVEWDAPVQYLTIYNALGQQMHTEKVSGQNQITLDISFLSKGIYFLSFTTADNEFSTKLLVNNYRPAN